MTKLGKDFFNRNAVDVAKDMLGKNFVHNSDEGKVVGKIVETEAYSGEDDLACHASKGKTARTKIMYGDPAHLYVYLNYGIFYMTNIVCGKVSSPEAVLLRSIEILEGKEIVKKRLENNKFVKSNDKMATGPGKLSVAYGITKEQNGLDISGSDVYCFSTGEEVNPSDIIETSRIGVDYAKHCKDYLWRFYIRNNQYVSKK